MHCKDKRTRLLKCTVKIREQDYWNALERLENKTTEMHCKDKRTRLLKCTVKIREQDYWNAL